MELTVADQAAVAVWRVMIRAAIVVSAGMAPCSAYPAWARTERDPGAVEFAPHGRRVQAHHSAGLGEGLAFAVAAGRLCDVALGHLPVVDAARNAPILKVRCDGPLVDTELQGDTRQGPTGEVAPRDTIDLSLAQTTLNRSRLGV